MAEVSGDYPAPILGVSTLPARTRANGQMTEQINLSSDPVQKLTRRPPLDWLGKLTTLTAGDVKSHVYVRAGKVFRLLVQPNGIVKGFVNNVSVPVTGNLTGYIEDLQTTVMRTVNDTTFVVNQEKIVRMLPNIDTIQKVTHVNVTAALNYGETIKLTLYQIGGPTFSVEHTVPDIGATSNNLDAADKARATAAVAESLAAKIAAAFDNSNIGVAVQGSSIAIWNEDFDEWQDVRITTGQGDKSAVVINRQIENIAGLPLYAVVGTRIIVRPNPTSNKGTYYLTATRVSDIVPPEPVPPLKALEEVVWTESRSAEEPYKLDATTMPHTIAYDEVTNSFIVGEPVIGWSDRKVGDNQSCKPPAFVDTTITSVSYMQKRLVVLTENEVVMSKTDDIFNWWKTSAVQLVVTDPVSIASSATGVDKLVHVVPHNKDLLVIASNAQFKIPGDAPVTPETVSMPLVATYNCSTRAEPQALGSSVFLPVSYGDSCGLFEYTREQDKEQDNAKSVSNHVVGYMSGTVNKITTSANLDVIILQATNAPLNTLFVFEQFQYNKEELQQSWSKWVFPFDVVAFDFIDDSLVILYRVSNDIFQCKINLYSRIKDKDNIFLDNKIRLVSATGLDFYVPSDYDTTGAVAVVLFGKYRLNAIKFTRVGDVLTLERPISEAGAAVIMVGKPYVSSFKITRPFIRDQEGRVTTEDRLRVTRFIVHLVNTGNLTMRTTSPYYDTLEQNFVSRTVGGITAVLGEREVFTGDQKFSFGQDASLAEVEFYTDGHLGLTVAGISWIGQYHQTRRKL